MEVLYKWTHWQRFCFHSTLISRANVLRTSNLISFDQMRISWINFLFDVRNLVNNLKPNAMDFHIQSNWVYLSGAFHHRRKKISLPKKASIYSKLRTWDLYVGRISDLWSITRHRHYCLCLWIWQWRETPNV